MKPFDDPEASRPKLPADVLAFVAEVEARANNATPGPWEIRFDDADEDDPPDTIYLVRGFGPWNYVEHKDIDAFATVGDTDGNDAKFIVNARADVPALIAIVREQGALLKTSIMAADVAATALEMCAAENDSLRNSRTALEEQAWRISEERDALRERLAKLETAIDSALDGLYGLSFTPKVFDEIAKKRLDELKRARGT